MDTQRITDFIDPCNHVARILISHFLAIQMVVSPITDREFSHRIRYTPVRSLLNWVNLIYDGCPPHLQRYMEWPKAINDSVETELLGKQGAIPILRKNEGYSLSYC
jgi:hypothetical protein